MVTKKQLEDAIINLNHNSDNMANCNKQILEIINKGFSKSAAEHADMIGELKRTNDKWFRNLDKQTKNNLDIKKQDSINNKHFLNFLKWFISLSSIALFGAKLGGLI